MPRRRKKILPFPNPCAGPMFYLLEHCHGNVRICSGCGREFKNFEGEIRESPRNLILVLKGRRLVPDEDFYSRPVNMYFHPKIVCLQITDAKLGLVVPRKFRCPEEIMEYLDEDHARVIKRLRNKPSFGKWGIFG